MDNDNVHPEHIREMNRLVNELGALCVKHDTAMVTYIDLSAEESCSVNALCASFTHVDTKVLMPRLMFLIDVLQVVSDAAAAELMDSVVAAAGKALGAHRLEMKRIKSQH